MKFAARPAYPTPEFTPGLRRWSLPVLLLPLLLLPAGPLQAHGATIETRPVSGIEIHARFNNGNPMREAQVSVFSPADPNQPWLHGRTNEHGTFRFFLDPQQHGTWAVQARQAGHGATVQIQIPAPAHFPDELPDELPVDLTTKASADLGSNLSSNLGSNLPAEPLSEPLSEPTAVLNHEPAASSPAQAWSGSAGGSPDPIQRILMAAAIIWGFIGTALYFRRERRG